MKAINDSVSLRPRGSAKNEITQKCRRARICVCVKEGGGELAGKAAKEAGRLQNDLATDNFAI